MRRTTLCRPLSFVLCAALLGSSGCVFHFGDFHAGTADIFGQSVSTSDGVITVDGTKLPFNRWVDVTADLAGTEKVELGTASDTIRVSGAAGTTATLKAHLYSEIEGDGKGVFENGRLVARSQGNGVVFINAIEGTVPAGLALTVESGTGSIEVSALSGDRSVDLSNGTGDIALRRSSTGAVKAETGTGDILIEEGTAPSLTATSGTGSVALSRCHSPEVTVDEGTGDATLTGCECGAVEISSGTGDLVLDAGKYDRVHFSSGTGDLTQRNGVMVGSLKED
jgi:Putative adhesin